jgi:hypothetical protein
MSCFSFSGGSSESNEVISFLAFDHSLIKKFWQPQQLRGCAAGRRNIEHRRNTLSRAQQTTSGALDQVKAELSSASLAGPRKKQVISKACNQGHRISYIKCSERTVRILQSQVAGPWGAHT